MKTMPSFSREHDFPEPPDGEPDFEAIARSPEFIAIRRRLLRFTLPMTALFLCWYLGYVLLAAYAHDFMSQRAFGNVTVGLLLGLSQFVSTIVIMVLYLIFAKRRVDPQTAELAERMSTGRR
ncbi:uncharacterized membrane protein (DUF485 family) [Kibdelosporangium banguiense]|uniref:Uncharacterized membrane protein (DUF485 family) n=1 Tax=Kibdelosporangium banguiense TaxID=1365924 RepID=A0ABS4TPJ4_9PSEU|nr:DUF485 domain-containing protein [Kibdelosporangium banguiense]MBP2325841.1 uncharacterized membrane protein (DUF485 family) [Kibdelosporangium banguiense]